MFSEYLVFDTIIIIIYVLGSVFIQITAKYLSKNEREEKKKKSKYNRKWQWQFITIIYYIFVYTTKNYYYFAVFTYWFLFIVYFIYIYLLLLLLDAVSFCRSFFKFLFFNFLRVFFHQIAINYIAFATNHSHFGRVYCFYYYFRCSVPYLSSLNFIVHFYSSHIRLMNNIP